MVRFNIRSRQEEYVITTQANIRGHQWWSSVGRLLAIAAGLVTGPAGAATPKVFMESATISGASDAVTLTRVPVQDAAGNITYKDVQLFFSVDSFGALTLPPASVQITASPTLAVGRSSRGRITATVLMDVQMTTLSQWVAQA